MLCTINVQHPCANNGCAETAEAVVNQERKKTSKTRPMVEHKPPHDLYVVNTAQMRDARILQRFRLDTPILDRDATLYTSAETLAAERIQTKKRKKTGKQHPATKIKQPGASTTPAPPSMPCTAALSPVSATTAVTPPCDAVIHPRPRPRPRPVPQPSTLHGETAPSTSSAPSEPLSLSRPVDLPRQSSRLRHNRIHEILHEEPKSM